uniref:Uncharacterized protein n=1 Tax=Hucho hucho TaxID=62062 RepID=A0A4W5L4I4_9TELE
MLLFSRVLRKFDGMYKSPVAMVAHLYFQVVHALLIFDLVLFMLKNVGFSLRKDDALALKELISGARGVGTKFQDENRVRFMLETMLALKNNDMRKIPVYDPEPVERLQKLQRTLIHQSSGASDVKLRVSLENLLAAEQVGRWWIVGSSWSRAPMIGDQGNMTSKQTTAEANQIKFYWSHTHVCDTTLFSVYRMGIKDRQESEIVHLLMDCYFCFFSLYIVPVTPPPPIKILLKNVPSLYACIVFYCLGKKYSLCVKLCSICNVGQLCLVGISGIPKLEMLREGLKLFISHFLLKNAQSQGPAEQTGLLSERAEVAMAMEVKETKLEL